MSLHGKVNRRQLKWWIILLAISTMIDCSPVQTDKAPIWSRDDFANVLNVEGTPEELNDFSNYFFADQGAWFGFSLPESQGSPVHASGFVGPFLLSHGSWISKSIASLEIHESRDEQSFQLTSPMLIQSDYYPGMLRTTSSNKTLEVVQELCFADANTAVIQVKVTNLSTDELFIKKIWTGALWMEGTEVEVNSAYVNMEIEPHSDQLTLAFGEDTSYKVSEPNEAAYKLESKQGYPLESGATQMDYITITYTSTGVSDKTAQALSTAEKVEVFTANKVRWDGYINDILSKETTLLKDPEYQNVAVKSLQTLILNWRSSRGALRHGGLFPSAAVWYFNGFWGWDSWKHVVALARFAPEIAEEQILTMFDFQDEYGMIADCIYADSTENNWRNTKPPLAAWAVSELYDETQNLDFVKKMYPRLVKYHEWWYKYRDHDQDGLCEFGSTDGSLVAAKWESGVDDGIHYDNSKILKNTEYAWSLDQESVDLNAYLSLEKSYLAKLSTLLKDEASATQFADDAVVLKKRIQSEMFDPETGFYYDISIDDGDFIGVYGPQGWIPLWTGVATAEQASRVREIILDPEHFSTHIPFPTVSKSNPAYLTGYWRGPVWLDQAFFGISGLRRYGYEEDAMRFTRQLIDNAEGLKGDTGPIRENYNPETGEGMKVYHFSWSAAHLLMMLWEM